MNREYKVSFSVPSEGAEVLIERIVSAENPQMGVLIATMQIVNERENHLDLTQASRVAVVLCLPTQKYLIVFRIGGECLEQFIESESEDMDVIIPLALASLVEEFPPEVYAPNDKGAWTRIAG